MLFLVFIKVTHSYNFKKSTISVRFVKKKQQLLMPFLPIFISPEAIVYILFCQVMFSIVNNILALLWALVLAS